VRELRDQFVSLSWARALYNGMWFSPEVEFLNNSIEFSQRTVNGSVNMLAYKGNVYVVGRKSETSNLYSEEDASMDSLATFSPLDTTGFIAIQGVSDTFTYYVSITNYLGRSVSRNMVRPKQLLVNHSLSNMYWDTVNTYVSICFI
jgi:argininosuccinate synthase